MIRGLQRDQGRSGRRNVLERLPRPLENGRRSRDSFEPPATVLDRIRYEIDRLNGRMKRKILEATGWGELSHLRLTRIACAETVQDGAADRIATDYGYSHGLMDYVLVMF
jgi:hypothetical protein